MIVDIDLLFWNPAKRFSNHFWQLSHVHIYRLTFRRLISYFSIIIICDRAETDVLAAHKLAFVRCAAHDGVGERGKTWKIAELIHEHFLSPIYTQQFIIHRSQQWRENDKHFIKSLSSYENNFNYFQLFPKGGKCLSHDKKFFRFLFHLFGAYEQKNMRWKNVE